MPQIEQVNRGVITNNHHISVNWDAGKQPSCTPIMSLRVRGASASPPGIRRSVRLNSDTQVNGNGNGDIRIIGPRRQGSLIIRRQSGPVSLATETNSSQYSQRSLAAVKSHARYQPDSLSLICPATHTVRLQPVNKSIHPAALTRPTKGISIVIGRNEPISVVHTRDSGKHDSSSPRILVKQRLSDSGDRQSDGSIELVQGLNRTIGSPSSTLSVSSSRSCHPVSIAVTGTAPLIVSCSATSGNNVNVSTTLVSRSSSLSRCKPPIYNSSLDSASKSTSRTLVRISSTVGGGVLVTTEDGNKDQVTRSPRFVQSNTNTYTSRLLRATSSYDNLLSKDLELEALKRPKQLNSVRSPAAPNLYTRRLSFGSWSYAMPNVPVTSADVGMVIKAECSPHNGREVDNRQQTRTGSSNEIALDHRTPSQSPYSPPMMSDLTTKTTSDPSKPAFHPEHMKSKGTRAADQSPKHNPYFRIALPCTRATSKSKGLVVTDSLKLYEEQILNHYNPYQRPQSWCVDLGPLQNEINMLDDSSSTSPASTVSSNSSSSSGASQVLSSHQMCSGGVTRPRLFHCPVKSVAAELEQSSSEEASTPTRNLPANAAALPTSTDCAPEFLKSQPYRSPSASEINASEYKVTRSTNTPNSNNNNNHDRKSNTPPYLAKWLRLDGINDNLEVTRPTLNIVGTGESRDSGQTSNSFLSGFETIRPNNMAMIKPLSRSQTSATTFQTECFVKPQPAESIVKDHQSVDTPGLPTTPTSWNPTLLPPACELPQQLNTASIKEENSPPLNTDTLLPGTSMWYPPDGIVTASGAGLVSSPDAYWDRLPTPVLSANSSIRDDVLVHHQHQLASNTDTCVCGSLCSMSSDLPSPPPGLRLVHQEAGWPRSDPCYQGGSPRHDEGSLGSDFVSTFTDDDTYAFSTLDSEYLAWMRLSVRDVTNERVTTTNSAGDGSAAAAPLTDLNNLPRVHIHRLVDIFNSNPLGLRLNFVDDFCHLAGTLRIYINLIKPVKMSLRQTMDMLPPLPPSPPPPPGHQDDRDGAFGQGFSALPAQARLVSFFLPRGTSKVVYITSSTTAVNAIQSLLDRFHIQESARKFSLYEHNLKDNLIIARKISPNECPLLLLLNWVRTNPSHDAFLEYLKHTRIVLQENDACDIDWKDFTKAELLNFLKILDKEEAEYRNAILYQYGVVQHHLEDRLNELDREAATARGVGSPQNYSGPGTAQGQLHSAYWSSDQSQPKGSNAPRHEKCECDTQPDGDS